MQNDLGLIGKVGLDFTEADKQLKKFNKKIDKIGDVEIPISANTSKAEKSVSGLNKKISQLDDVTINVEAKLKDKAIQDMKKKLASLKDHVVNIDPKIDSGGIKKLKSELKSIKDVSIKLGVEVDDAELKSLEKKLKGLENQSISTGSSFSSLSSGLKAGLVGGGVIAGVTALVSAFSSLKQATEDVRNLQRQINQLTGGTGDNLDLFTAKVSSIADTFNKDSQEVAIATNALAKSYDITFSEAADHVAELFARGADATGELIPSLTEFSSASANANTSIEMFLGNLEAGAKAGVYADKYIDGINEVGFKLGEMGQATKDALKPLGEDFKSKLIDDLNAKVITTEQAYVRVNEQIKKTKLTTSELYALTVDVGGTQAEEVGGIVKQYEIYEQAVTNVTRELTDSEKTSLRQQQASEELNKVIVPIIAKLGVFFTEIKTTFSELLASLAKFGQSLHDNKEVLAGIATVFALIHSKQIASFTIQKAIWLWSKKQLVLDGLRNAATLVWNLLVAANPIGAIATVAALLVGWFVKLALESDSMADFWANMVDDVMGVVTAVGVFLGLMDEKKEPPALVEVKDKIKEIEENTKDAVDAMETYKESLKGLGTDELLNKLVKLKLANKEGSEEFRITSEALRGVIKDSKLTEKALQGLKAEFGLINSEQVKKDEYEINKFLESQLDARAKIQNDLNKLIQKIEIKNLESQKKTIKENTKLLGSERLRAELIINKEISDKKKEFAKANLNKELKDDLSKLAQELENEKKIAKEKTSTLTEYDNIEKKLIAEFNKTSKLIESKHGIELNKITEEAKVSKDKIIADSGMAIIALEKQESENRTIAEISNIKNRLERTFEIEKFYLNKNFEGKLAESKGNYFEEEKVYQDYLQRKIQLDKQHAIDSLSQISQKTIEFSKIFSDAISQSFANSADREGIKNDLKKDLDDLKKQSEDLKKDDVKNLQILESQLESGLISYEDYANQKNDIEQNSKVELAGIEEERIELQTEIANLSVEVWDLANEAIVNSFASMEERAIESLSNLAEKYVENAELTKATNEELANVSFEDFESKQALLDLAVENEKEREELKQALYLETSIAIGSSFGAAIASGEDAGKKFLKVAFDILESLIPIMTTTILGWSLATPDSALTLGASGLIKAGIISALLTGAVKVLRGTLGFEEGGLATYEISNSFVGPDGGLVMGGQKSRMVKINEKNPEFVFPKEFEKGDFTHFENMRKTKTGFVSYAKTIVGDTGQPERQILNTLNNIELQKQTQEIKLSNRILNKIDEKLGFLPSQVDQMSKKNFKIVIEGKDAIVLPTNDLL